LVVAASAIDASKECRRGAFSSEFSPGFDVRRCALIVKMLGEDTLRFR